MSTVEVVSSSDDAPPSTPPGRPNRWRASGLAGAALLFSAIGLSGVGDAPDPHSSTTEIAEWFTTRRTEILHAAPFGYLGALAVVGLAAVLAGGPDRPSSRAPGSARALRAGGLLTAAYLAGVQIGWSSNAYLLADSSPEAARAVFVLTITSVPVLAAGVALVAGGAAVHGMPAAPRAWRAVSAAIALAASVGLVATASSGFLSPDVQQQAIGNSLLVWLLLTALAAAWSAKHATTHPRPSYQEATS